MMNNTQLDQISKQSRRILDDWLESCTRNRKISRNTIAIGIVVLDHLRHRCPVERELVISKGGEVTGARSGLRIILEAYDIPGNYLKEVTTRQGHQDGQRLFKEFEWGEKLIEMPDGLRDELLLGLIGNLKERAYQWMKRQNLKLDLDRRQAPTTWINVIIENAKGRSGGIVEQQLVGAKLERRFKEIDIPNHPSHAADWQTDRSGDFTIAKMVYHVTAAPTRDVIRKCANNVKVGLHPILLVPNDFVNKSRILAQDEGIDREMVVLSIEDFVAMNIIELATEDNKDFFSVLKEIVQIYNRRLAEVETDLALQIEVR